MTTLAQLLAASRVFALRNAVVAAFAAEFAGVSVKPHLGRLDMTDVQEGTMFSPPAIHVGVTRIQPAERRMSGTRDVPVEIAAYVVAGDKVIGGKATPRDEIAMALCDGVLAIVEDDGRASWGLPDIHLPTDAEVRPLFTAATFEKGTVFYAVTWRQILSSLGTPFMDMASPAAGDVAVVLPGDPDWFPPEDAP